MRYIISLEMLCRPTQQVTFHIYRCLQYFCNKKIISIGVNLYTFGVDLAPPPIISNFNIRPMSLHGKNGIIKHKFNI